MVLINPLSNVISHQFIFPTQEHLYLWSDGGSQLVVVIDFMG